MVVHSSIRQLSTALLCLFLTACAQVDVVGLTKEGFRQKPREGQVAALEHPPQRPYLRLAELSLSDTQSDAEVKSRILQKAAELGADAVIFSPAKTKTEKSLIYQRVSRTLQPLPYTFTVTSLTGIAIRFTDSQEKN